MEENFMNKQNELNNVIYDLKKKEENLINNLKVQKEFFDDLQYKLEI